MEIAPHGASLTIILCAIIGFSNSLQSDENFRRNRPSCGLLEFRCLNGECIKSELLCDGRADCSDLSDETREECMKSEIVCPEYAFRCNYGACIDGDAPCNGIQDCVDNSDEQLPRCRQTGTGNASCPVNDFRCNNGQCVPTTSTCDGTTDCADRSDETNTLCNSITCPAFTFRCDYGACIDGDLKCNGIRNCADGSDENRDLCRGTGTTKRPVTERPYSRPTTTTRRPTQSSRPSRPNCAIPSHPQNGLLQLHKSQCQNRNHCAAPQSGDLEPGTYLVYSCNKGYTLKGSSDVFCGTEGKWSSKPVCVEIRCKPLSTASTAASCTYNDEWSACELPVLPNTRATVSCRNSYSKDSTILSIQRENVRCNSRGQWEPEPIRCVPVCGVISPKNVPLITGGTLPKISEFPWHATLYKNGNFVCGATIIQSDLLITAAHCVYDENTRSVEEPSQYTVATGNIFQDYNSPLHNPNFVKKANVKQIYVICNYLGLEGNYAQDIAILHIERPFVFSSLLVPICLDVSVHGDVSVLEVGNFGKVAGFGRTTVDTTSKVLQSINVPYVSFNECKASTTSSDMEKFITIDKFCAGYTNGSAVCDGDSGGGLVFKTGGLWYLRGIVSVGIGSESSGGTRRCNSHAYSLYTRVSSHIEWIQDIILKLEIHKPLPVCRNRTIDRSATRNE